MWQAAHGTVRQRLEKIREELLDEFEAIRELKRDNEKPVLMQPSPPNIAAARDQRKAVL
jgi:hypothetical protein